MTINPTKITFYFDNNNKTQVYDSEMKEPRCDLVGAMEFPDINPQPKFASKPMNLANCHCIHWQDLTDDIDSNPEENSFVQIVLKSTKIFISLKKNERDRLLEELHCEKSNPYQLTANQFTLGCTLSNQKIFVRKSEFCFAEEINERLMPRQSRSQL